MFSPVVIKLSLFFRLKTELEDRRTVQNLLDDYMKALNKSSERNLNLIKSVRKKVNCIDDEKKEVKIF